MTREEAEDLKKQFPSSSLVFEDGLLTYSAHVRYSNETVTVVTGCDVTMEKILMVLEDL